MFQDNKIEEINFIFFFFQEEKDTLPFVVKLIYVYIFKKKKYLVAKNF